MRKIPPLLLLLVLAACGTHWEKPGADQATADNDGRQCRHAAQQESLRAYAPELTFPFYSPTFWGYMWFPSRELWRKQVEADVTRTENRLAVACMRNKGYEIVPVGAVKT